MAFDLGNLLQKYLNVPADQHSADATGHFDEVARHAPPDVMGEGIADALRSDQTPPLGQMVSDMFSRGNPQQQAGMLNQILGSLNPGVLGSLGGVLGGLAGQARGGQVQITPEQASTLSPQQVQDLANHAENTNPGIFDKLGGFYAQHPDLVKTLGSAALTIALAKMANRMRS
jgi:hypothetical protein